MAAVDTLPGIVDTPAAPAELSARRLNLMRLGYAFVALGLALAKWPGLVEHARTEPAMDAVVACMLTAMSLLMFLGLRYPARMLPILLFEAAWKVIWFAAVGLPRLLAGHMDPATHDLMVKNALVIVVLAVIPWRSVWNRFVKAPGDAWRRK
jgi:hypothetical protein